MENSNILVAEKVSKSFGPVNALSDVDITIGSGEIRGLIGENGSGKSTFASICAGIQRADSGTLLLCGQEYKPGNTIDAMNRGVSMVIQEQGTISGISVAANIFLGKEKLFRKHGILNAARMEQEAQKLLDFIGADFIKAHDIIDTLTFEDRKLVELARTQYCDPKLWIIDETTTALTVTGRELLYKLMKKTRDKGCSVLFISHDIDEIQRMCDSLTILRDGVVTANLYKEDFDEDKIKQLMIGREMSGHYYREDTQGTCSDESVLEAREVCAGILKNVTVSLHKGEILGLGGLNDCGIHELGKVMAGLISPDSGKVYEYGTKEVTDIGWAVDHGIGYVSKNRNTESMMPVGSIADNICLPSLKELSLHKLIRKKTQKTFAEKWSETLEVKSNSVYQFCNALSGGNKQKVVLAKWLGKDSSILILDCPTRGIDIKTKASIYHLIEDLKKKGKSILLISEELPELIGMSDRIVILKDGAVSGEFQRAEGLTEAKLIQKMI